LEITGKPVKLSAYQIYKSIGFLTNCQGIGPEKIRKVPIKDQQAWKTTGQSGGHMTTAPWPAPLVLSRGRIYP
jgi:hypothetical protein